uniref:Uncharacterized protein LOC100179393 n=1 Tax=Phallusia mammillata TaxID=59560 RepID=A0A6F9DGB3_9ASCI|nr:uncharacterized protein LOC100179393 [Phallusia mammillata]
MEELESNELLESNMAHSSTSAAADSVVNIQSHQWCNNCKRVAEVKYKRSMEMLKKKILFTDNLITMFTQMKSQNEEFRQQVSSLEQKCKEKDVENKLIQKQIKSLLSNKHPSELEQQKDKVIELEKVVDNLNDQIRSMDMTCKMYEDKIQEMREADVTRESERKNYHNEREQVSKEIKALNKTIKNLERENMSLKKKNEVVRERLRRRRSSRSSQATDSEANMSFLSEDATKTEGEEVIDTQNSSFKSPLPDKKKRLQKKHRKSDAFERSDDDHDVPVAHISRADSVEIITNSKDETEPVENEAITIPEKLAAPVHIGESDVNHKAFSPTVKAERLVLSSTMKDRMKEMKAKRAYRIFAHRPTNSQLKEMKSIVQRLDSDAVSAEDEIKSFCVKHTLVGHETHVAKKILKHIQEQINMKVSEKLQQIVDKKAISSSSETDAENSLDREIPKHDNFAHPENALQKNTAPDNLLLTKQSLERAIEDNTNQQHKTSQANVTEIPCNDKNEEAPEQTDTQSQSLHLNSKAEDIRETTLLTQEIKEVDIMEKSSGMFSSDDENICEKSPPRDTMAPKLPQKNSPSKVDAPRRARTRSISKSLSEGSDSSFSLDKFMFNPLEVLSPFRDEPIGLSSPNRKSDDAKVQAKKKTDLPKKLAKKRAKSSSKADAPMMKETTAGSLVQSSIDSEISIKSKKRVNDHQLEIDDHNLKHFSNEQSKLLPGQDKPKKEKKKQDKDVQQNNTGNDQVQIKPRLQKRTKRKIESPIDNSIKKKQIRLDKHFAIIKSNNNNNIDTTTLDSPAVDPKDTPATKLQKQVTKKPLVKLHPTLRSMQSLPFKVGSESPLTVSPKPTDFNFLPVVDNQGMDSGSESDESISVLDSSLTANQIDQILTDITGITKIMAMPLSPLQDDTPSSSMITAPSHVSSPIQVSDVDEDMEDDNRPSISPSANLCTAISFNKEHKALLNKSPVLVTPKKKKSISQHIASLRDTPRRFSCEAPIRALPVPTVKPVAKTKSCDPSLLMGTEKDSVSLVVKENEPSTSSVQEAKDNTQTLSHVSSGPFKVVPQTNVLESQDCNRSKKTLEEITPGTSATTITESIKSNHQHSDAELKKIQKVTCTPKRFVFEPLIVHLSSTKKISQEILNKTTQEKKTNDDDKLSVAEVLDKIEKAEKQPTTKKSGRKRGIGSNTMGRIPEISNYFGNYFDMKHLDTFDSLLNSIQEVGIADETSGYFPPVIPNKVISWIRQVLTHTRGHNTSETVEKLLQSGFQPQDPELDEILQANELIFVKLLATVDKVRSKTDPGLLKTTVIPTILKTLCRYGHGIGSMQETVEESSSFFMMSSIFQGGSFTHYDTASLTRIFTALCRYCGDARAMMDLCKWACTNKYKDACALVILDMVPCWPSAFTHCYPLTGRILMQMSNMKLRSRTKLNNPLQNLAKICKWEIEPNMFTWRPKKIPPVKWTSFAMMRCLKRLREAEMVQSSDDTDSVLRLAVEDHDDVYNCLEMYCFMEGMNIVAGELIDKEFWALLNEWSTYITLSRKIKVKDKKVSDGCVVAVLKALSTCLLALLAKQKRNHPTQDIHIQAINYFDTICSMVQCFTKNPTAPIVVQCAAVATVLNLAPCKPDVAHSTVQSWLIATSDIEQRTAEAKTCKATAKTGKAVHKHEKQISALLCGNNLRKSVSWIEKQNKKRNEYRSGKSITLLLWG